MHDDELWQVFRENGQPIVGRGALDDAFDADHLMVVGNAHVWFWKKTDAGIEILLQKRAITKKRAPGYYHISAGGHINVGETAVAAAVRETTEEMGVSIDPDMLYLVHVTRTPRNWQDLAHVFIYQLKGDEQFSFDDGEVDSVSWYSIEEFESMTANADVRKLVNQGEPYFSALTAAIRRQVI